MASSFLCISPRGSVVVSASELRITSRFLLSRSLSKMPVSWFEVVDVHTRYGQGRTTPAVAAHRHPLQTGPTGGSSSTFPDGACGNPPAVRVGGGLTRTLEHSAAGARGRGTSRTRAVPPAKSHVSRRHSPGTTKLVIGSIAALIINPAPGRRRAVSISLVCHTRRQATSDLMPQGPQITNITTLVAATTAV